MVNEKNICVNIIKDTTFIEYPWNIKKVEILFFNRTDIMKVTT